MGHRGRPTLVCALGGPVGASSSLICCTEQRWRLSMGLDAAQEAGVGQGAYGSGRNRVGGQGELRGAEARAAPSDCLRPLARHGAAAGGRALHWPQFFSFGGKTTKTFASPRSAFFSLSPAAWKISAHRLTRHTPPRPPSSATSRHDYPTHQRILQVPYASPEQSSHVGRESIATGRQHGCSELRETLPAPAVSSPVHVCMRMVFSLRVKTFRLLFLSR